MLRGAGESAERIFTGTAQADAGRAGHREMMQTVGGAAEGGEIG